MAKALTFCVPLFATWFMLYAVEHDFANASNNAEAIDSVDLADNVAGSNKLRQVGLLGLGSIGGFRLLRPSAARIVVIYWLLFLIVVFCALMIQSALWADDSVLSLKRSAQPLLLIIGAAGIVKHLQPRQLSIFVVLITSGVLLLGVIATIGNGSFLEEPSYRFGGTLHPNIQAVNCGALCLASFALLCEPRHQGGRLNWRWLVPLLIGLTFLYLTRSRTTSAALAAAVVAFLVMKAPLVRTLIIVLILSALAPALAVLWLDSESNMSDAMFNVIKMGREDDVLDAATLTGRIPIWRQVLSDISAQPLLGYGYGAFWTSQRIWEYSFILDWQFNHAHSAYLETLLNNGVVGLAFWLLIVVSAGWIAVVNFWRTGDVGYRFAAAMMAMALIHGVFDSNFVVVGFGTFLLFMCVFLVVFQDRRRLEAGLPTSMQVVPLVSPTRLRKD